MTKAELQKRRTEHAKRIELEERIEDLEDDVEEGERDSEELGSHFAALCDALDEHMPFHTLPIRLRLDFEALAERLDVALPLPRVPIRGRGLHEG